MGALTICLLFVYGAVFSWLTIPRVAQIVRKYKIYRKPSERDLHWRLVPKLTGIVFYAAFLVISFAFVSYTDPRRLILLLCAALLESSQGPMVLYTDGTYDLFSETLREVPEGFVRDVGTIVWLDDSHIGISTSFFPEGGGGTTSYWTAFNLVSGEEVDEIEGTDFRVVVHDGSIYTSDGRVTWTGTEFRSDGQGYAAIQDIYGNLWDKGGVYGLTLVDEARGLQLSLGEEGTEGPNIYLGSGTGTGIAYRDFAFDDYWVLNKYSRKASDVITSVMGVA